METEASGNRATAEHREAFVAGTGTFAAEIADWARAAGVRVVGLLEMFDETRVGTYQHGLQVLPSEPARADRRVVLGVGGDRRASWRRLAGSGWAPLTVVHPFASLAFDVSLGPGATLGPASVLGAASAVGDQAIVSRGALIGHHVEIGAYCTINPGVNVGGNARIGSDVFVGMGATLVNGVNIGAGAVIAAGAVVLGDVEAGARVQGIPARAFKSAEP